MALVETPLPVCVERFVDYPQLGRFTLRDEGAKRMVSSCASQVTDFLKCISLRANGRHRKGDCDDDTLNDDSRLTLAFKVTRLIDDRSDELADGVSSMAISSAGA